MSEDKAVFFWPRHEVLHLITPSLCQSGRNLSNSVVLEVARQLYKVQTPDGLIRCVHCRYIYTNINIYMYIMCPYTFLFDIATSSG